MKFTWFNLMPWPYLPPDFRQKHRSVWVDIDSRLFDAEKSHELYNTYIDLLEYAGKLGFDGIGVNEHHQNAYGLMPSPNLIAAGLARRTRDVAIVVLGASIALYNPPLRVADGGRQSPALGLGHELDHATVDPHIAEAGGNVYDPKYDNREERRVIAGSERHAATTLGEDVRHDHRGWTYRVDSPVKR